MTLVTLRARDVLSWWLVFRRGTPEERQALVASLSPEDVEAAAWTLDLSDEQVVALSRAAVYECVCSLRRRPFDPPV